MTHAERCNEILGCKAVTSVIQNAPTFGLTEEFIRKHRIHIVCCGIEYVQRYPDPKDDPYYRVPRQMGIARPLPRTEGLSTSDLIGRIQAMKSGADDRNDGGPASDFASKGKPESVPKNDSFIGTLENVEVNCNCN